MVTNNSSDYSPTQYNVQSGGASGTLHDIAPSATSGVPVISQGAASQPVFGTALVAGGGTGSTSFSINGVLISGASSTTALSALTLTNGQIVIGATGNAPLAATLTAGAGITITNAANSITIAGNGTGFSWTSVTGASQTIVAGNGYLSDNAGTVAFTLPASSTIGDLFEIVGVIGAWTLAQHANQQILFGSAATTVGVGGSLASTNAGDSIRCVATNTSASSVWRVASSVGNITVV